MHIRTFRWICLQHFSGWKQIAAMSTKSLNEIKEKQNKNKERNKGRKKERQWRHKTEVIGEQAIVKMRVKTLRIEVVIWYTRGLNSHNNYGISHKIVCNILSNIVISLFYSSSFSLILFHFVFHFVFHSWLTITLSSLQQFNGCIRMPIVYFVTDDQYSAQTKQKRYAYKHTATYTHT